MSRSDSLGEMQPAIIYTSDNLLAIPIDYTPFSIDTHRCKTILEKTGKIILARHYFFAILIKESRFVI